MNGTTDYLAAKRYAQVNANRTGTTRWLHLADGLYWTSKIPILGAERVLPDPREPCDRECDDRRAHGEDFCRHGRKGIGS